MSSTNTQLFYDKTVKRIVTQSSRQRSNPNRLVPLVLSSLKGTSKHSHFLLRILLCTFLIFWTSLLFFLLSLFDYISDSSDPSDAFLCLSTDYPSCSLGIEFSIYRYLHDDELYLRPFYSHMRILVVCFPVEDHVPAVALLTLNPTVSLAVQIWELINSNLPLFQ